RAVIALHRGAGFLEAGDLPAALRSFSFALEHGEESRAASNVLGLSRRWLSYVVGRYAVSDDLLTTLWTIVPRQDFYAILEDLLSRSALRADAKSFALCTRYAKSKGALDLRVERLRTLAAGNLGQLATALRDGLAAEPYAA